MRQKRWAPCWDRKVPETFCWTFAIRISRSAWLLSKGTRASAKTHYNRLPYKFEAGTPHIAGVVGLGAAVMYVQELGLDRIAAHETALLTSATTALAALPSLRIIGTAQEKACVVSFVLDGIHPHDIGTVLDQAGLAIWAGHHCAMPVMQWFGVPATARVSFGLYNTHQEVSEVCHPGLAHLARCTTGANCSRFNRIRKELISMPPNEPITLRRTCEAIRIPSGERVSLPAGSQVRLQQALGGTYTVLTQTGGLVRIANTDADALEQSDSADHTEQNSSATTTTDTPPTEHTSEAIEALAWEQLKTCFDPEIPVNIVDLGLVYHCQVSSVSADQYRVEVKFTLTAPGCGMGEILKMDIEDKLRGLPHLADLDVAVVFEPLWTQDMLSEAAKLELGL